MVKSCRFYLESQLATVFSKVCIPLLCFLILHTAGRTIYRETHRWPSVFLQLEVFFTSA